MPHREFDIVTGVVEEGRYFSRHIAVDGDKLLPSPFVSYPWSAVNEIHG